MRGDGSRIRTEKVADSKISGYVRMASKNRIIERRENDTVVSQDMYLSLLPLTVESHEAVTRIPSFQHKHETKQQI